MAELARQEARSAFRKLVSDSVPDPSMKTRVWQMLESIVFGAEPILRGVEYFEVRYGSGAPVPGNYPEDGYGIWIDQSGGAAYVVLQWRGSFFVIGGSGAGSLPAHTHDHLTEITNVGTNTHAQLDTHVADGTIHFLESAIDHQAILNIGVNSHAQIDAFIDLAGPNLDFYNGTFIESFNALVTESGGTVTMELEQSGGGDLTMAFSDGLTTLDCTPVATIELTVGSDSSPQTNYIYILESTKVLTKSTSQWPSAEHIKVGYFLVPSAAEVSSEGVWINQNWNDHRAGTDDQGHLSHICETIRLTMGGANWDSGIGPNASGSEYLEITGSSPSVVEFKSTAGVAYQMHKHTVPAIDMNAGADCHVVNWNGDAYHEVADLADIIDDAAGGSLSNKWFNLIFWGVANKAGEYHPLMCNLPNGSYVTQAGAEADVDGHDVTTLPREFVHDSTTGFLICRVTCKQTPGGAWSLGVTKDLRGVAVGASAGSGGSGGSITDFPDNQFTIFAVGDSTKILDFDLSGLTPGNTRTITPANANMTLLSTTDYTDLTDGGNTSLHAHDIYLPIDGSVDMEGALEFSTDISITRDGTVLIDASTTGMFEDLLIGNSGYRLRMTGLLASPTYSPGGGPDVSLITSGAASWIDLTDSGETALHTHANIGDGPWLPLAGGTLTGSLYLDKTANPTLYLREAGSTTSFSTISDVTAARMEIRKTALSGAAYIDIDPILSDGSSNGFFRFFRWSNTSGSCAMVLYEGDGTATEQHRLNVNGGNASFCQRGGRVICGGVAVRIPYLGAAPAGLANGDIWMESDGLHIYYAGAEKVAAGI